MYMFEDVMDYVREEDVKFIRLAFCDIFGKEKNIAVMPDELERAFTDGISFDASAITGFGTEVKSDLFLKPEPSTLSILPWHMPHGQVVRMFCDICTPNGEHFEKDCRHILKEAVKYAKSRGFTFMFGSEFEFYLFKTDENGVKTESTIDNGGYMDIYPEDRGEHVRREICYSLLDMGIKPESSHHEEGPGQQEIDFQYSDAMTAADNATTFKAVVKAIAMTNGVFADFSPKPLTGESGNGLHINISVQSVDGKDYSEHVMAGIMKYINEISLFLNPTEESYLRLGEKKAPKYITWSPENRSQLIRIPAAKGRYTRIELRSPDPTANPYLAFALLIYAGMDGIENKLKAELPTNQNLFTADAEITNKLKTLPKNLSEAYKLANESSFVAEHLPEGFVELYKRN